MTISRRVFVSVSPRQKLESRRQGIREALLDHVILEEIELASRHCTCGIFLFTKDDELAVGGPDRAAPRDNVVFEAGYFASSKGHTKALIVREEGARMPADVDGSIYLLLRDKDDIQPIETALKDFVERRL